MIWANALVLGLGGALLTMPVILHFLMQPKPKILEFPALRFVKKRQLTNKSKMRLRHIVLLILRCLLILLMAAALAGPSVASREFGQWVTLGGVSISALVVALALATVFFGAEQRNFTLVALLAVILTGHIAYLGWAGVKLINSDSPQLLGDSAAPVSAIILIDSSFRMDYMHENKTNLDRAKELGGWLIEQFPADSQACVLTTDTDIPFYSVDLGAARNRVENLEVKFSNSSLPSRLTDGLALLDEAEHERKEVYIISDLSQQSWKTTQTTLRQELGVDPALNVFVLDVGRDDIQNYSLAPLELERESLTENGEIQISTTLTRVGPSAQRSVRFRVEKEDKSRPVIRDRKVLVPEQHFERTKVLNPRTNGSEEIQFKFSDPLSPGIHHGFVEVVGDDSLVHDNVRYFTIEIRNSWEILVVHGDDVTPDNLTTAIIDDEENSLFNCTIIHQDDIPGSFDKYQTVIFLDPSPGIPETTWANLNRYVSKGHGVGFFLGANAAKGPSGDISFHSKPAQKLLTGKLARQWRRPDADLFLSPDNLSHPIFRSFRNWETAVPWNDFPVFIHWSIEPGDDWNLFPTKTILRYGNGKPAIIERQIDNGVVLVMTTPITESARMVGRDPWNELFLGLPIPAWLLVRQINDYLVQSQSDRLNLRVDEIASLKNDYRIHPNEYRIFTPRTTTSAEKLRANAGSLRYRFTSSPGQYRLSGKLDQTVIRGFSVNLAEGETNLSRIVPADLDQVLGANNYQLATDQNQIQRQQGTTRRGQEFYPLLLLMLVVVLGVEFLLATRFYS